MIVWTLLGVELVYFAAVIGILYVLRARRKSRWPFKAEDRLLRGPGEELRRKLIELDEQYIWETIGGIAGGVIVFGVGIEVGRRVFGPSSTTPWILASIVALIAIGIGWLRVVRVWQKRQKLFLGWFGERYTSEYLEPAKLLGWRVFHDVPFVSDGKKFNVDHVAVGPGGVLCIETKTRRKGNARPGFDDHKVYFDGRDLVWPWAEDNYGLDQAERNALWLTNWIRTEIGERVHVSPILALPGWWLEKKPARESRLCQVVNPKWLPGMIEKLPPVLSPKQIELIALRFEARCRDVEE